VPPPIPGKQQFFQGINFTHVNLITATPGQEILPLPEGSRYLGFAFARGDDPAFVEAALRTAERLLDYEVDGDA
jgi:hypothetical protein